MYILGTAGHVDHGKSTLVKALTGIDPDRWAEEQRRQMTIDLGFAWCTLPSGRSISLIDVPGHERFIKNMLAGVGGIDAALLIIAADEACMPQTLEHLAILDLLGIDRGLIVLTKADLVEPEWLALVADEVRATVRGSSLEAAPLVSVSARTGQGLDRLLAALDTLLDTTPSRTQAIGAPRLSIDRAFTVGGFGTVVTGTLIDGRLQIGDEVEILPQGVRARVRGLQSQQQQVDQALPGSRVAVNLAGIAHSALARGNLLAGPGTLTPTELVDVRIRLVADLDQPLVQNAPLELFVGAAQSLCRATLLDSEALDAGASGWVQLRLAQPLAVARGDRYIVRQPSPSRTIGGGVILDAHPARHRRFRPEVALRLAALSRGTPADLLRPALEKGMPLAWAALLAESGLDDATAREGANELLASGGIIAFDPITGWYPPTNQSVTWPLCHLVTPTGADTLREKLATALRGYHRRYPLRQGIPREDLRSRLKLTSAALDALLVAEAAVLQTNDRSVWLAEFTPILDPAQKRTVERLLAAFRAAPHNPPTADLDEELLAFLIEQGTLVRLNHELVLLPDSYAEWVGWVHQQLAGDGNITVAQFRDHFATSRRYALALLEQLDERKVTRRVGDVRVRY